MDINGISGGDLVWPRGLRHGQTQGLSRGGVFSRTITGLHWVSDRSDNAPRQARLTS